MQILFLFILGPCIAMMTACMTGVVIPWGNTLLIDGKEYIMQITDINVGILFAFAVVSFGVYGIMIGGWASNNKYSLLGAWRIMAINSTFGNRYLYHSFNYDHWLIKFERYCNSAVRMALECSISTFRMLTLLSVLSLKLIVLLLIYRNAKRNLLGGTILSILQ